MCDTYASVIVGLIPVLTMKMGLSLFLVSVLTSANFISANFFQPLFGYLSDKYGARYFMVASPLITSIFISLLGILPRYWLIIIFLFFGNLGIAAVHPPTAAMAGYIGGKKKGIINSIISFGGTVGLSAGSLFIISIVEKLGIKFSPVTAIPGIIIFIVLLRFASWIPKTSAKTDQQNFFRKIRSLKKVKLIILLIVTFAAYSRDLTFISMLTFMPLYYTNMGIGLIQFGYIILLYILMGGIGGLLAGYFSDKLERRTAVIQGGIILSVPFYYFMFKVPVNLSVVFFMLGGFFLSSTLPLCIRIMQDIFPGSISLASSMVMGVSGGIAAATVILIGKIADSFGIIKTVSYVLIAPVLAFILLFLFPHLKLKMR